MGNALGIDIGYKRLIATSDGNTYGNKFSELAAKIQRKKQGSKGFKKALIERDEYVNKTVKELPLKSVKVLVIEELKGLKNGKRFRKEFQAKFQRWTYPVLVKRLELASERLGVQVTEVNPAYTSQTCSRCGSKDKNNRKGEAFTCISCGYKSDADINASVNILKRFRLPEDMDPVKLAPAQSGLKQTP
jgi:putative transposase